MSYVFISHSTKDFSVIEKAIIYLEKNGIPCWFCERDIPKGVDWADAIPPALKNAGGVLYVRSERSQRSDEVAKEIHLFTEEYKSRFAGKIVVLKIDDCETTLEKDIYHLSSINRIDAPCGIDNSVLVSIFDTLGKIVVPVNADLSGFEIKGGTLVSYLSDERVVEIPPVVTEIGYSAFYEKSLVKVTVPETVTKIGSQAFYGCKNLSVAAISDSVTEIGSEAFEGTALFAGSEDFVTADDFLLKYRGKEREVTVPEYVRGICDEAFSQNRDIEKVVLSEGVKFIGKRAFEYCPNLREVDVAKSVRRIGRHAFKQTEKLTRVLLRGEKTELEENWIAEKSAAVYAKNNGEAK